MPTQLAPAITKCNVCRSNDIRIVLTFSPENLQVRQCNSCTACFLSPALKPKSSQDEYVELKVDRFYKYIKKVREVQFKKDLGIIQELQPSGTLLDIGSSYGFFLNMAHAKKYEAIGIEPSKSTIAFSKKHFPSIKKVLYGEFETLKIKPNSADVITLWSVLEHTLDPSLVVKKAAATLKKGGILCIRVPNSDGLLVKVIWLIHACTFGTFDKPARSLYLTNNIYKHFFHFNLHSLTTLLAKHNLSIVRHYYENSLNKDLLKERMDATPDNNDISFLQSGLVRNALKLFLMFCTLIRSEDEIVIFAQKE